jgi:hypothetical protein
MLVKQDVEDKEDRAARNSSRGYGPRSLAIRR